ncbi:MAG: hypothetical protein ACRD8O_04765 [Bryobacteraceae bacterium]
MFEVPHFRAALRAVHIHLNIQHRRVQDSFASLPKLRRTDRPEILADVVGPVCESGDFLARNRRVANVAPANSQCVQRVHTHSYSLRTTTRGRARPR